MAKKRVRKRIKFTCSRCSEKFIATGCTSGMCKACRKLPPGEAPHCACGCGEKTAWKGAIKTGSWNKYIQGHHLKDKDWNGKNPGFEKGHLTWNKGNREYSGVCAREGCDVYFESSWDRKYCSRDCANIAAKGREPWHKGLNKHMDDRVAALGRSVAASRLIEPVHNKGKTKDDYEPLKRAGENISIVLKDAYAEGRLIPWAKGLDKTDERVARLADNVSKTKAHQLANGELIPRWYKFARCGWMTNVNTGETEYFRSSYEAAYMDYLNKNKVNWTASHGIIIEWYDKEEFKRRYVPDFFIKNPDGSLEIHEIKSEYLKSQEETQRKTEAGIRYCEDSGMSFSIFTEKDMDYFKGYDPTLSKWFIDYDDKTKSHMGIY